MNQLLAIIPQLDKEDLFFLNHQIIDRLRLLQKSRQHDSMLRFAVGEMVSFTNSDGVLITGRIIRLNQKTITLVTDDRQQWKVSPSLLSKVISTTSASTIEDLTSVLKNIGQNEPCSCGSGKKYKDCHGR